MVYSMKKSRKRIAAVFMAVMTLMMMGCSALTAASAEAGKSEGGCISYDSNTVSDAVWSSAGNGNGAAGKGAVNMEDFVRNGSGSNGGSISYDSSTVSDAVWSSGGK